MTPTPPRSGEGAKSRSDTSEGAPGNNNPYHFLGFPDSPRPSPVVLRTNLPSQREGGLNKHFRHTFQTHTIFLTQTGSFSMRVYHML